MRKRIYMVRFRTLSTIERGFVVSVTHVTVVDVPVVFESEVVGRMFAPEFETIVPDHAPNFSSDEEPVDDSADVVEKDFEDAETKVIRRGRRPRAVPTEGVETK